MATALSRSVLLPWFRTVVRGSLQNCLVNFTLPWLYRRNRGHLYSQRYAMWERERKGKWGEGRKKGVGCLIGSDVPELKKNRVQRSPGLTSIYPTWFYLSIFHPSLLLCFPLLSIHIYLCINTYTHAYICIYAIVHDSIDNVSPNEIEMLDHTRDWPILYLLFFWKLHFHTPNRKTSMDEAKDNKNPRQNGLLKQFYFKNSFPCSLPVYFHFSTS